VAVIVANLELSVKELKAEREQEENPLEDQVAFIAITK